MPKVLLMDEPTAALGIKEKKEIYALIDHCKKNNVAIVIISHNIDEVFELADRVTVMYLGKNIASGLISEITPNEISQLIMGTYLKDKV